MGLFPVSLRTSGTLRADTQTPGKSASPRSPNRVRDLVGYRSDGEKTVRSWCRFFGVV